jgi:hypothetical protein
MWAGVACSLPVWLPIDPLFPAVAVLVVVETLSVVVSAPSVAGFHSLLADTVRLRGIGTGISEIKLHVALNL